MANGCSLGGESKTSGCAVEFETRRMVVVAGAWERLSRASEGAGRPSRLDCPGIGSSGGSGGLPFGSEVGRVEDDWAASLPERLEDEDEVPPDLDELCFSPKEVAIALRDDVTVASNRTDEMGHSPVRVELTFGRMGAKLVHLTVRASTVTSESLLVHLGDSIHDYFPLLARSSCIIRRRRETFGRAIGRLVLAVGNGFRVHIIAPSRNTQRVIEWQSLCVKPQSLDELLVLSIRFECMNLA